MKELVDKIQDAYLRKVASREISVIEDMRRKWQQRVKDMVEKGWCFIDDRRELYSLMLKEAEEVQNDISAIDFWIERAKDEGFPKRLLEIFKHLLSRTDREIRICKFFVMSKDTFAKDRIKDILRFYRRELTTERRKADIAVILRNEFRESYPHICRHLQNVMLFDESLAIVELSDQFGESTGTGPVIGRNIPGQISEEEKREYGVLGNADRYLDMLNTLKELTAQRDPTIIRII
jgi:hypothetical protein